MSDYDKQQWQAEQDARERTETAYRDKMAKARERSAANARRKLERLHRTLSEKGELSDFEDEFGESVLERLDKFGSAFADLEKGRAGDALSFAQKSVVARMNKKVKELRKRPPTDSEAEPEEYERTADRWKNKADAKPRKGFKSRKPSYQPRVRHIEDDLVEQDAAPVEVYIPKPDPAPKRPFLRLVK